MDLYHIVNHHFEFPADKHRNYSLENNGRKQRIHDAGSIFFLENGWNPELCVVFYKVGLGL